MQFSISQALLKAFVLEYILKSLGAPSMRRIENKLDCRDYARISMNVLVNFNLRFQKFSEYLFRNFCTAERKP